MAEIKFEGVTKAFKDGTVAVDNLWLAVPDGEFMILVGPSGCGKTTSLRMVAGLEDMTTGDIVIGDRVVNELEPGDRDVSMIFQNYALFPHMTVFSNIGFPLIARGVSKREVVGNVAETAKLLGLDGLLERMPHELSGGQRQRVAMGRAIIRHPQAFLMDEPLSNLDAKLRTQMRGELARLHRRLGITTLYVTHDQTEAMTLGSKVAVMRNGILQQVGIPRDLYDWPANAFVASFIGSPPMNMMYGRLDSGRLSVGGVDAVVDVSHKWPHSHGPVVVGVRPEAWRLSGEPLPGTLVVRGEVEVVEELGPETILHFSHNAAVASDDEQADTFAARIPRDTVITVRTRIEARADLDDLQLFDAETGTVIPNTERKLVG